MAEIKAKAETGSKAVNIRDKDILIVGAGGMLGRELSAVFPHASMLYHTDLDITDKHAVFSTIQKFRPAVVINAAAFTRVEDAESEKKAAMALNGDAVGYLAAACRVQECKLLHFSTDYVFDGEKDWGYDEGDSPNPLNVYGESKLSGEVKVRENMDDFYIIRTSALFGVNGKNFVETIIRLARTKPEIKVVNDQVCCPTYAHDLAIWTRKLLESGKPFGIYHLTNSSPCSWFEFAREIVAQMGIDCNVVPCGSDEYPSKIKRPKCTVLNNNKFPLMPEWKNALERYIRERKN